MKLSGHLVAAAPFGLGLGLISGSPTAGATGALSAVLVDADHVLDYLIATGRFEGLDHFFDFFHRGRLKKILVLFHSYELWLAELVFLPLLLPPALALGILAGHLYHLLIDQLFNPVNRWGYFLTWRLRKRLDYELFFTPGRSLYAALAELLSLPQPAWTKPFDEL